jgi:N-acetylmuramoyl-L-alanine amidase
MTNRIDAAQLERPTFRRRAAQAIARGIERYLTA